MGFKFKCDRCGHDKAEIVEYAVTASTPIVGVIKGDEGNPVSLKYDDTETTVCETSGVYKYQCIECAKKYTFAELMKFVSE